MRKGSWNRRSLVMSVGTIFKEVSVVACLWKYNKSCARRCRLANPIEHAVEIAIFGAFEGQHLHSSDFQASFRHFKPLTTLTSEFSRVLERQHRLSDPTLCLDVVKLIFRLAALAGNKSAER